jgi:hypothetical protein
MQKEYLWSRQSRDRIQEPFIDKHSIGIICDQVREKDWNCPPPGTAIMMVEDINCHGRGDGDDLKRHSGIS